LDGRKRAMPRPTRTAVALALAAAILIAGAFASAKEKPRGQAGSDSSLSGKDIQEFLQGVAKGKRAYDEYDYEAAVLALEPALAAADKFPADARSLLAKERIDGTKFLAFSNVALERFPAAEAAFRSLLALDPKFDPGNVSPKIRKVFDAAKRSGPSSPTPGHTGFAIDHAPVASVRAGLPMTVRAGIRPPIPGTAVRATLFYRTKDAGGFSKVDLLDVGEGVYVGVVPGKTTAKAKVVQYYLVAQAGDAAPAEAGTKDQPFAVEVLPPVPGQRSDAPKIPEPMTDDEF
jgi:hypothetical protein